MMRVERIPLKEFKERYEKGHVIKNAKIYEINGEHYVDADVETAPTLPPIEDYLKEQFVDIIRIEKLSRGWLCDVLASTKLGLKRTTIYVELINNNYVVRQVIS